MPIVGGPLDGAIYTTPIFTGSRPVAGFLQLTEVRSDVFTKYHALVLQANRRLTHGLQFQSSYTLSRAQDNGGSQSSATFTPGFSALFDPFDASGDDGLSTYDRRHKFVASVVYNTNFTSLSGASAAILNGWTISPIVNMFSGFRYTPVTNSFSTSAVFGASPAGGINGSNGSLRFALLPNNSFHTPSINYVDLRLSRRFTIKENAKIEVLAKGFNIFNRTQVTGVNNRMYVVSTSGSNVNATFDPTFGTASDLSNGFFFRERQIQFAVRFEFYGSGKLNGRVSQGAHSPKFSRTRDAQFITSTSRRSLTLNPSKLIGFDRPIALLNLCERGRKTGHLFASFLLLASYLPLFLATWRRGKEQGVF